MSQFFRKTTFACLLALALKGQILAQGNNPSATPKGPIGDNDLLAKLVDSAMYVVRVDYVLHLDDGVKSQDFVKDDKEYFGRGFTTAVACDGKLWFDRRVLEPWENFDKENYARYKDDKELKPRRTKMFVRSVVARDRYWEPYPLDSLDEKNTAQILTIPYAKAAAYISGADGQRDTSNSFFVMVAPEREKDLRTDENSRLTLFDAHPRFTINKDSSEGKIPALFVPLSFNRTLGGVWFTVKKSSFGTFRVQFMGLTSRARLTSWSVYAIPPGLTRGTRDELRPRQAEPVKVVPPPAEESKKDKKKKKNEKDSDKEKKNGGSSEKNDPQPQNPKPKNDQTPNPKP